MEAIEDGAGPPKVLYHGTIVQQLALGLAADPQRGPIDISLPPNRASHLRLRQVGHTRVWFWAIDEMQLSER